MCVDIPDNALHQVAALRSHKTVYKIQISANTYRYISNLLYWRQNDRNELLATLLFNPYRIVK